MLILNGKELLKIKQAFNYEKKHNLNDFNQNIKFTSVEDIKILSNEDILFLCDCLSGFVDEKDDFLADNIISKLLIFLQERKI